VRVLFLGTPDIAVPCFEELLNTPGLQVVGCLSQPDRPAGRSMKVQSSPVKQLALSRGVPVLTPESARTPDVIEWIRNLKPDSAVVVAYGQILSKEFLSLFPRPAVNIHASLLPRWRGAAPIQRSIIEGDSETGVALQVIVSKLDAGPILGIKKISIAEDMTSYDLYMKLRSVAPALLAAEFIDHLAGRLVAQPQDESKVTIAQKVLKEEGSIDWSLEARKINRKVRGLWMWPGSWTVRNGKTLKVWKNAVVTASKSRPGEVLKVSSDSFTVGCGEDALEIFEVQPESRAKMNVSEYLKGYTVRVGEKIGL
jgi:methionyl-tRNA formyltransferase